jgi:hypothetical protein
VDTFPFIVQLECIIRDNMIESRRPLIPVILLLAIVTVGVTLSAIYFSMPTQPPPTSSTTELNLIGAINTGGGALRVHVKNNLAFVIDFGEQDSYGLIIVNISNPTQPEILGTFHDGGLPFAIETVGDIVYIADQLEGLRIINITNPSQPIQIEGYTGSGCAYDLEVVGDLLFLADNEYGMVILNISTPSAPVFVSSYGSRCIHLDVEGDMAYITGQGGITLVDISDPIHPTYTNQFSDGSAFWDPSVSNGIIYMGNHNGGIGELQIFDASTPTSIEKISEFDSEGHFQSFFVRDSILYAVDYESGLYLLDVTNSSSPVEVERFSDGGRPWDVTLDGDYVYLCGSEGLQILQVTQS